MVIDRNQGWVTYLALDQKGYLLIVDGAPVVCRTEPYVSQPAPAVDPPRPITVPDPVPIDAPQVGEEYTFEDGLFEQLPDVEWPN
jgi:hypothetical protein